MTIFLGFTTGLFLGALLMVLLVAYLGFNEQLMDLTKATENDTKNEETEAN